MFGLAALDILIGLITLYLAFAVACTAIVEAISGWLKLRSKNLEAAMAEFLQGDIQNGEKFVTAFYEHPLIQTLSRGEQGRPSYIPAEIVGNVVASIVTAKTHLPDLQQALAKLPDSRVKSLLETFLEESQRGADTFQQVVAKHFNATMDRASGWFKRKMQLVTVVVALILVISVNVDTVALATSLASNPAARAVLVRISHERLQEAQAAETATAGADAAAADVAAQARATTSAAQAAFDSAVSAMQISELPLGWSGVTFASPSAYVTKIIGLLISIAAISLGAPFWFQVLQKFNAVRTTGTPEKSSTSTT